LAAVPRQKSKMRKIGLRLSRAVRKVLLTVLLTVAVVYAGFASVVLWAMHEPPETFGKVMAKMPGPVTFLLFPFETAWLRVRSGSLRIGDPAPDFSLLKLDKSGRVQLSDLTARQPVVLIFGSYT
jgi:hypothetical protein